MQEGQRKLLSTVTFQGADYHIVVVMQMTAPNVYSLNLYKGDWQAAFPEILGSVILDNTDGSQGRWPDPKDYVAQQTAFLEILWRKVEDVTPAPAPGTWAEKLEAWLLKVAFFHNTDGTHTIKIVN